MEKSEKFSMLKIVWKASAFRFVWMGILVVLSVVPKFVSVYGLKLITDYLVQGCDIKNIAFLIVVLVSLEVFNYIVRGIYENVYLPKSDLKISEYINGKIFEKIQTVDAVCYDDKDYYEKVSLAVRDADSLIINNCNTLLNFLSNVAGFIFIVAFIVYIDWAVIFVPIVALVLLLILNLVQSKLFYRYNNDKKKSERFLEYLKRSLFDPYFAYELIISPIKKLFNQKRASVYAEMTRTENKYDKKVAMLSIINNVVFSIFGFGVIMFMIAQRVTVGAVSIGDFVGLANASLSFVGGFMAIASIFPEFVKNKLIAKNISRVLYYRNAVVAPEEGIKFCDDAFDIAFHNVDFAYPFGEKNRVLKNIELSVPMYRKIAIVGCNGAGKSTLIKLILRLYDVTTGNITIGGRDIKEYAIDELRENISVLLQNFKFMPVSIAENILMRPLETAEDENIVWRALKFSGLDEKVKNFENTIYTVLSKEFDESGAQLSGGELQKLCLARVFAQKAKIIILDEPSSSLDALSENYIFNNIYNKLNNKTVIFVTHRLNAAYYADEIILMKDGKIAERGTHEQLMGMDGEYRNMFCLQVSRQKIDPQEKTEM